MAESFFNEAPSTFEGYHITDDQINALESSINGKVTATDTAKQLTAYPEASPTPLELQQRLGGLWTLLNDTAVAVPSAQPAIISILQIIRTLPKIEEPKGEGEDVFDFDDGWYWRELTGWANNWADSNNSHASRYLAYRDLTPQEQAARKSAWKSACAYAARLVATGDEALGSYGNGLNLSLNAVVETLEVDHGDKEPDSLEAAAQLFLYASPELYRRSKEGRKEITQTKIDGLWNSSKNYSEARWKFWEERWAALTDVQSISEHARAVAREALDAMKQARGGILGEARSV